MFAEVPTFASTFLDWWPILLAGIAALGATYRIFKRGMENLLGDIVEKEIKPIQEQFVNNGGSTLKDAVDRMAIQMKDSNDKADTGLSMASATNDRVVTVAAETAEKVEATNARVTAAFEEIKSTNEEARRQYTASIQKIEDKLDMTADQMHVVSEQRAADNRRLSAQMERIGEQVTASTAKIHTVTANLRAAYFEVDENTKMVYCNDSFLDLLGITYSEAMAGNFNDLIAPEDRSKVQRAGLTALENKVEWVSDFTVVRKTGERIKVVVRAYPIWDGENFGGYAGALVEVGV